MPQFSHSKKCAAILLLMIVVVEFFAAADGAKDSRKKQVGKKHKHGKDKQGEKEEEEEDKKIKCYQCSIDDISNCTESEKDCKYCFTFNVTNIVEKGCLTKDQSNDVDDSQECTTIERNNKNGTICYCDKDLCNVFISSSNIFFVNVYSLLISFIVLMFII